MTKAKTIRLRPPPNLPPQPARRHVGQSGFGVWEFLATLFHTNELRRKPLTDEELSLIIQEEFPVRQRDNGKPYGIALRLQRGQTTVNELRGRYNRGLFTGDKPPKKKSRRYDKNGEVL